jgi:hypothetical protein
MISEENDEVNNQIASHSEPYYINLDGISLGNNSLEDIQHEFESNFEKIDILMKKILKSIIVLVVVFCALFFAKLFIPSIKTHVVNNYK